MVYSFAFTIHIFISTFTLVSGFFVIFRSLSGWLRHKPFTRTDTIASVVYTLALYLQFILGFMIYFTLRTHLEGPLWDVPDTKNDASLRFWAIEHIALMIFALFLTQLGRIYIRRSNMPEVKFKASLFYYGTSMLLILFSVSIALFF